MTRYDLPSGWVCDFDGRISATFRRDDTGVVLNVEPRYGVGKWEPGNPPEEFRVLLRHASRSGRMTRSDIVVDECEAFEDAISLATEYMQTYNDRLAADSDDGQSRGDAVASRTRSAAPVAVASVGHVGGYTDDLFVRFLRTTLGDDIHAVWHVRDSVVEEVYARKDASDAVPSGEDLTSALSAIDWAAVESVFEEQVRCATSTLATYRVYQFFVDDGHETVVLAALSDEKSRQLSVQGAYDLLLESRSAT